MDKWESFLDSYPPSPDIRSFGKALQFAKIALQEELAPFEIEWLLESLLHNPVNLITTVESNYLDECWTQPFSEAFKRLQDFVEKHEDSTAVHFPSIVALCNLPLAGNACRNALTLLKDISCVSPLPSENILVHIRKMSEGSLATTERVALIGAICKHHPESASDHINNIWRTFLILLDSNKNTDKLTTTLLQGIHDLFIHFGTSLPVIEINAFYDKLVTKYLKTGSQDVCLQILANYYELFIERFSKDSGTRSHLWELVKDPTCKENAVTAFQNAYKAICKADRNRLQSIINKEIRPLTLSNQTKLKYTALRILTHCVKECPSIDSDIYVPDELTVEFQMRNGTVTFDVTEAVSWCLEANLPNAANILQTAILFSHNFPGTRGKEIVKRAILNASSELRYTAVSFLTTESIQSEAMCMERHYHTWQSLFDSNKGKDTLVVEKSCEVFKDFVSFAQLLLQGFLDDDLELLPSRIINLLNLISHVFSFQRTDDQVSGLVSILTPLLIDIVKKYECAEAIRTLTKARSLLDQDLEGFDNLMNLRRCRDEPTLCAMCEAVIESSNLRDEGGNYTKDEERTKRYIDNTISACRIIFGRNDVEPQLMAKGLTKLEELIQRDWISPEDFNQITDLLETQRTRKDLTGKDSRIFQKDLTMFLAKHRGHQNFLEEREIMFKLKDDLCLNLPEVQEGVVHKINLSEILRVAIKSEDPRILQTMLTIICANVSTTPILSQYALPRTILALCRTYTRCAADDSCQIVTQLSNVTIDSADTVRELIRYITVEPSPGVRQLLSDIVEKSLIEDQNDTLLNTTIESTVAMLKEDNLKMAGLDISETILSALKENSHNSITKTWLSQILDLISKINEIEAEKTFELGAKIYVEKIELFDDDSVNSLIKSLIATLVSKDDKEFKMADSYVKRYKKTVKVILNFVKNVFVYKKEETEKVLKVFFDIYDSEKCHLIKMFYVLSVMCDIFKLDIDLSRKLLSYRQYSIQNALFCMELVCGDSENFCMEAVLRFMNEYAIILLELQYQKTLEYLGQIIATITPKCVIDIHKTLKSCLSTYKEILKSYPKTLLSKLEQWCQNLNLNDITKSINKDIFEENHAIIIKALKLNLSIYNLTTNLTDVKRDCQNWVVIILKLYSKGHIEKYLSKVTYLTDLLTVAVKFMDMTDVKSIILEGQELYNVDNAKVGIRFSKYFMSAFCDRLCQKPYILLDEEMSPCSVLLNDIVKYICWKKSTDDEKEAVFDLVDNVWPIYTTHSTFSQQCDVLLHLNCPAFPAWRPDSNPWRWAVETMLNGTAEEKAKVIASVKGENFSEAYKTVATSLPTRMSELNSRNQTVLRAIIDGLSTTGDSTLLDIVCRLAGGDPSSGWWDSAFDACMASIQTIQDINILYNVYNHCFDRLTTGVVERLMVPLLRYSTSSRCEEFFAAKVKDLYRKINKSLNGKSEKEKELIIAEATTSYIILQIGFEKLPQSSLESPSSAIHQALGVSKPWILVLYVCKAANTLRNLCKGRSQWENKELYRKFHCVNYNCVAAAVSRWKPHKVKVYEQFFDAAILELLVRDADYDLPLIASWSRRSKPRPVSIELPQSLPTSYTAMTSQSVRSRMFLRTLSENPLQFDLIDPYQEIKTQEIELSENALNSHECAATVTALFRSCVCFADLTGLVATALTENSTNPNVKFLLAQTICNSREEVSPHAASLRPALLQFIVDTPVQCNAKHTLNQLHVDVMETLLLWSDPNPEESLYLDNILSLVLVTCMENKHKTNVFNTLLNLLTRWLGLYGKVSHVGWAIEIYLDDDAKPTKSALLRLLTRIYRARISIPQLLPTFLQRLEKREDLTQTSELFGLAVNCQNDTTGISKFRSILHQLKQESPADYVRTLYYAQMGCAQICDEKHLRMTVDQVLKQVGAERTKCFKILSSYVSENLHRECVADMFDTLSFCDIIAGDNVNDVKCAIELVKSGFQVIQTTLKRRIVNVIADKCTHNDPTVASAACEVILMDFKDLLNSTKTTEPLSKRAKTDSSPLIRVIKTLDVEYNPVIRVLSIAVATNRVQAAELLSAELRMRFKECFLLTVELPITHCNNKHTLHMSVWTSTFVHLILSDLRAQEVFKKVTLKEQGLGGSIPQSSTQSLKLLSGTRTYQGTFSKSVRSNVTRRKLSNVMTMSHNTSEDVTVSIDDILGKIIEFTQRNTEASCAFIAQLALSLKVSGFDFACVQATPLTRLVLNVMMTLKDCVFDNAGNRLLQAVEILKESTKHSEAENLVKHIYRNIQVDTLGEEQYVLGRVLKNEIDFEVKTEEFSLQDLTASFGQLSNWNQLTALEKRNILQSIPPLWTDKHNFVQSIQGYTGKQDWFSKLVLAYNRQHKQDTLKWLRQLDLWPRRYFDNSAIAEAIDWQWCPKLDTLYTADIQGGDCLASWAGRLMIRKAFMDSLTADNQKDETDRAMLSRSHELQWCETAIDMGLAQLTLDCVKRNVPDIYTSETLSWLKIQVAGLRAKGLVNNDQTLLTTSLEDAERNLPEFAAKSPPGPIIAINKLILQLHTDLNSLSRLKVQSCLEESVTAYQKNSSKKTDPKCKRDMVDIFQIAMGYYCDAWDDDEVSKETLLEDMTDVATQISNLDSKLFCQFIDVILTQLDGVNEIFTEEVAAKFLDLIQNNRETIDGFSLQKLKCHSALFPSHLLIRYPFMSDREDSIVRKYKQCFQLLSDPEYTLLTYCQMLLKALQKGDTTEWTKTFKRLKEILFENSYAGSDYILLNKYKQSLYQIENYCDDDSKTRETTLQTIMKTLASKKTQTVLKLSQLCPALASGVERESDIVSKLLGVKGTKVVGFDERVEVFTDSIRRPVIILARTSDGRARRYLVKLGDDLYGDAAAMRVTTSIGDAMTTYQVTPISEDCGLIEYLEDYKMLRALIARNCDLSVTDQIRTSRPPDQELILSQQRVMSLHTALTSLVPAKSLRYTINGYNVEVEDSVAHMVVIGWILGLGDRHLENMLCSIQDGRFCCVDWAAIFQYGVGEMPPARLTRNIVAACNVQLLESRMQRLLGNLRNSRRLLLPTIKVAFGGMGSRFEEKYPYIKSILQGETTSYHVTKDAILNSTLKHKEQYIDLLDDVFQDVQYKDIYSVEEQVSILLRQCTEPRILAVTRSGWEPWV